MEKPIYKVSELMKSPDVDFKEVYKEQQEYNKREGYDFDLSEVVDFMKISSNGFTVENPVLKDLDTLVYAIVVRYYREQGKEVEYETTPEQTEKEVDAVSAEWIESIKNLSELLSDGSEYSKEDVEEWREGIENMQFLLKENGFDVDDKGIIKFKKGGCVLKVS